ncbi:baseplate multidomain protein megatron [Coralliovum pocilloporae]|uniref:baseplate multidomain protein megatron n=1 Tax=Coralliovum pocilloporae TaxID=3066369 RepID=UPI0033077C66
MASLVLQTAGSVLGSALAGNIGALIGQTVGAIAGSAVDAVLFNDPQRVEGPRLQSLEVQTSTDGRPIPRVYGRTRLAGQVIWATRFEESVSVENTGGKGGGGASASVTSYSYFANFAVGLCEGEITRLERIWADGRLLDLTDLTYRIYRGTEDQQPDSLIVAKEGMENTPAYRGLAYVVFERLPLEEFGNRLPNLTFEVVRSREPLEQQIRAMTVIPGSTEFGYDPRLVTTIFRPGASDTDNRHTQSHKTDWDVSIDQLQANCPNLQHVSLVIAWFGSDLRCEACTLEPKVDHPDKQTSGDQWQVSGLGRATATLVSTVSGRPAFGGTPSDGGVIRAIRDLKARGLKVTLYPFILMDIPQGNDRPDPYTGATGQPVFPWRGRITCSPAPGEAGTPDQTASASAQVQAFLGTAQPSHFGSAGDRVVYSGPVEWSYRRMILHYARLAETAGGVDGFLIGSEMRGMTSIRSSRSDYPFVTGLVSLASDVKGMLGSGTKVSYAADWSEYFGHQPQDGSGDVLFNLDPLWASPAVDIIAIDNYMPLGDWRDGSSHLDLDRADSPAETAYIQSQITGGEGYDWFYAGSSDRHSQTRTLISDGAYGKPWVFRYKDLVNWWSQPHVNRISGVEVAQPTAWQPRSKPIWFTELGVPAVDKGGNQPNVFPDPKSSESRRPYFSSGARDDLIQRRALEASLTWWGDEANNPVSPETSRQMIDLDACFLWTWDARPFPAFPVAQDIWADGPNWETGHWLNGRLGGISLRRLIEDVLQDHGLSDIDIGEIDGIVDGYAVDRPLSARSTLEALQDLFGFVLTDSNGIIRCRPRRRRADMIVGPDRLVEEGEGALVDVRRAQETELPARLTIGFAESLEDHQTASVSAVQNMISSQRTQTVNLPVIATRNVMQPVAEQALSDIWTARETVRFTLPPSALALEPGDVADWIDGDRTIPLMITNLEDAGLRRIEARRLDVPRPRTPNRAAFGKVGRQARFGRPEVVVLSLPVLPGRNDTTLSYIAGFAEPWPGRLLVSRADGNSGFSPVTALEQRAVMGHLETDLHTGPVGVWDEGNQLDVRIFGGLVQGLSDDAVLNGGNALAVETDNGGWEVLQFRSAQMVGDRLWRLSGLLRAQLGTEDAMRAGSSSGKRVVLLDRALVPLETDPAFVEQARRYRVSLPGRSLSYPTTVEVSHAASARALLPLSPVHINAALTADGHIDIRWVRRGRVSADNWALADIPLAEDKESYLLEILSAGTVVRTETLGQPAYRYQSAEWRAELGVDATRITLRISQISAVAGQGAPATETLAL